MDDIQSWWEVPSIAHFCSLFRVAFNLLDFDIEELEEALLTDGTEFNGSSLLQDLIVRLLCGCLGHNGISTFNYQMFLRRLFRTKCKEQGRENPFNTDIDFQFLPLRTKVEILHGLCDFRLDADDVIDVLKNLDSDSLRVHPLGHDETKSAYWYFYGTRLYKEEYPKKRKKRKDHDKSKKKRKEESSLSSSEEDLERRPTGTWRVMCYTESDWRDLARSMVGSTSRDERALYAVLSEDFLPEIPRLFEEKERLQRKRAAEAAPRRASRRLEKIRQEKEEDAKRPRDDRYSERERVNREKMEQRERRAARALRRRNGSDQSDSSDTIGTSLSEDTESTIHPVGRQTNNSLSSATGEIFIQPTRQKFRTPQLFKRTREDLMTGMYKILDRVKAHDDAWPFLDPVNEKYAPKYYSVIAKPMDLQTMEDKLDNGEYGSLQQFKADFQLIVDNCRQYNGSENEYTEMVRRLQEAFEASAERYLEADRSSSDDEVPLIMHRNDVCMTTDESSLSPDNRRLSRSSSNHSSLSNESHPKPPFMNRDSSGERFLNRDNKVDKNRLRKKQKRKKKTSKLAFPSHDDDSDDSSEERYRQEKRKLNNKRRDVSSDRFERRTGSSSRDTSKDRLVGAMQKTVTNRSRNRVRVKRKAGSGVKQRKSSGGDSNSGLSKDKLFGRSSRDTSKERSRERVRVNYKERVTSESEIFSTDTDDSHYESQLKAKTSPKKTVKKAGIIKNVEALEALELATEQTLRDINKWLDDTPRFSDFSSCSNSPSHMPYMEDMSTLEGEYRRRLLMDRPVRPRDRFSNDLHRRRMFKEQMGMKRRREIQRTIDRLQPGKSKGNLLSKENQQNNNAEGGGAEAKGSGNENDENAPKISLGKVLPSELLSFGIGESQKKDSEDDCTEDKLVIEDFTEAREEKKDEVEADVKKEVLVEVDKKADKVETVEPKKEKPTPNLSAWFKAFGAPKAQPQAKRKPEPEENKSKEDENEEEKRINVESQSPARRQRKASTGSSVSERSSFSMEPVDGNSPRPSIDEPYLSPQQEVKAYHHSPINGTIKVGFYQDTCFPRGTSDKSSSPRDLTGCSPRDLPSVSPRTSYCSPRNPAFSPRDYPNASPRTEYCSPRATPMSPREYPSSPREPPSSSPLHYPNTSRDYAAISRESVSKPPDYTSYSVPHTSHATPIYSHYPSHLTYYDASKPVETKNLEKSSVPVYPVKKRAYNDIDNQVTKACEAPSYKGGSFTPTRGAMEQERTFTPTPGRMPGSSRVPDAGLPMALPHALQHRFDHYPEERHISSPFYSGEPVYTKNPIYSGAASVGLSGASYSREQQNYDRMAENQSPMSPSYHNNSRSSTPAYTNSPHDPQRSATPVISYPSRTSTPVHTVSPTSTPINYSNISDTAHKDKSPPIKDIPSTSASMSYNKPSDILSGKISTTSSPLPYGASRMDVLPPKVNSVYNRTLPELAHGINYNAGQDLSKISVPLGYSNQSEILAAKMNYNHPMADLMQSQARYNYQMSELMQGKAAVYNHPMQDFMQGKTSAYSNMNLAGYNRPISEIMQSKVNEIQARDMVYSSRTVPTSKAESTPAKTTKKTRKKKNEVPSGFQQYVSPGTEPISLKSGSGGVPGSAFNFGPSLKETYPYLDDIRTPYYVGHGAEGSSGKSGTPYFLGHSSGRTPPTYPHPFMNPQYQQYLQRHSEELLRPMVLPQGLLPPTGYPPGYLGIHDRPTWL